MSEDEYEELVELEFSCTRCWDGQSPTLHRASVYIHPSGGTEGIIVVRCANCGEDLIWSPMKVPETLVAAYREVAFFVEDHDGEEPTTIH